MWIFGLIFLIGAILTMFVVPCIKDDDARAWTQFGVLTLVVLSVAIVFSSHPDQITTIVESYQEGQIIKCETITIEGIDTVKVVKYKYK